MAYSKHELDWIYDRTSGYCHICGKKLARKNYGTFDVKGNWEVEHSNAQCNGGTDRACNLFAACISCNRKKGAVTTRTARKWHGNTCAPLSSEKRKTAKFENGVLGAAAGGVVGGALFGPPGAMIGAAVGGYIAGKKNPDKMGG